MTRHTTVALAAIALLASMAEAQAQSDITMYGIVDAAVSFANAGGNAHSMERLDSAVGPGSRLGFRGNEDLGGGLKAVFTLEMGFDMSSGVFQQGALPWGRQIFVGVGGDGWGVTFGRQYSPTLIAMQSIDAFGQAYWGSSAGYGIGSGGGRRLPGRDGPHQQLGHGNVLDGRIHRPPDAGRG